MNSFLKYLLYFLGVVLVLLIIIQIFLSFYAEDYAGDYIKEKVRNSTDSTYTIKYDDFSLNVFLGSASFDNLRIDADTAVFASKITPSSTPPKTLYEGSIGQLDVSGINVVSAALGDELSIGSITISKPNIERIRNPRELPKDSSSNFSSVDSSIYAAISNRYKAIEVGEFTIEQAKAISMQSADTLSSLSEFNLQLRNIRVDSSSAHSGRLFITKDISLSATDFYKIMSDSLNKISFTNFELSTNDHSIQLDSLNLEPRYAKIKYSQINEERKDRTDLIVPELKMRSINFQSLIDSSRFYAPYAEINNMRLEDFLNKSVPRHIFQKKELPFTKFRELNQAIKIDTLRINDSYIAYSEYLSKSPQAGTVTFENLNASFFNISNYQKDVESGLTTELDVETQVFGAGQLNVHFEFPMDTKNGFHTIEGKLGRMPITTFNRITKYIAFVQIDEGILNSLEFNMVLNENRSNGDAIMNYENLKISMLDAKTMQQKGIKENIISFVANNFVIKESNTPESGMQAGRISFERIKHKSMFNYWWKSLLSGIKTSVK